MNLDINYAKGLVKNYAQNQWQIINQSMPQGTIDSRCGWLSLVDLQNFIAEIQQQNPEGVGPATGIRIYFGTHSAQCPNPNQPNTDGLHTLLLIPTFTDPVTGLDTDFDAATGSTDFSKLITVSALNHDHLIPPPYNTSGQNNMYQQGDLFMDFADNH